MDHLFQVVNIPKHGFQLCSDYDVKKHPANAIAEVKYDGMMVVVESGRIYNRKGRDVTAQFPEIKVDPSVVIVGEIVILINGLSQFHMIQKRNTDNPREVALRMRIYPATLVAFDVLEVNGHDLQVDPLSARRKVLEDLEKTGHLNGHVYVTGFWGCPPEKVDDYLQLMRDQDAEGIVVKDLDAPYKPIRNPAWMKLKAWKEAEYDILRHETTENGGFVVWISNKGYEQKVVVNKMDLVATIKGGNVRRLLIRYLFEEPSGALRQPHVYGVPFRQ